MAWQIASTYQLRFRFLMCNFRILPPKDYFSLADTELFFLNYCVCPICEQSVSEKLQTESYKKRWRQTALPHLDDRSVRVALLAIYLRRGLSSDEGFERALKEAQGAYPDKTINQLKAMGDVALVLLDAIRKK